MAGRKGRSSKTDHVLNLLSGPGGAAAPTPAAEPEAPAARQAEVQREPAPAPAAAAPEGGRRAAAPILEVARANSEALEHTIQGALEQALESELASAAPPPEEPAPVQPPPAPEPAPEPVPEPEEIPPEPEPAPAQEAEPAPEPVPAQEEPAVGEKPASRGEGTLPDGTICVNVMQELVEEKAERYIRMFGLCDCPRCVADVKALALTSLPAKYVVLQETARRPMVSLYRARYDAPVTAQLLSACKQVMDAPRHGASPQKAE